MKLHLYETKHRNDSEKDIEQKLRILGWKNYVMKSSSQRINNEELIKYTVATFSEKKKEN